MFDPGDNNDPAVGRRFNDDAPRALRIRKYYRNVGLVSATFFTATAMAAAYSVWITIPPADWLSAIAAILFFTLFVAVMWGLSVRLLLAYWRESLTATDSKLIQQCVIRRKEFDLSQTQQAHWRLWQGGSVVLRSSHTKLTIYFDNFEPAERLWLIRHLRRLVPDSNHHRWETFCDNIAAPLRRHTMPEPRTPSRDEAVVTRRRWAWYFAPFLLASIVIGVVGWLQFDRPRMLAAPAAPAVIWLALHLATPKQGIIARRMSADPDHQRFLLFAVWWCGIAVVAVVIFHWIDLREPHEVVIGVAAGVCWFGVLFFRGWLADRAMKSRSRESGKTAAERWEEEENRQRK